MKKNCTGCKEVDVTCNCTIEVLRENEFDIIILLDTDQGFKWCPESTVDSNFFKCSPDSFTRIKACQIMIFGVVLFVYGLAFALVGCYSCRAQKAKSKKTENRQFRKDRAVKIKSCLRDIRNVPEENEKLRKSKIKKTTQKMSMKIRLHLITVADNLLTVATCHT